MNTKLNIKHLICLLPFGLLACSSDSDIPPPPAPPPPVEEPEPTYQAKITRTQFNVAHIEADNLGSIGFGQGYSNGQDAVCVLADQFIKINGERSRYLGAGPGNAFLAGDIGFSILDYVGEAQSTFDTLSDASQQLFTGYAAGYNQYLADTPADQLPEACANAEWVKPIDKYTVYAYLMDASGILSASAFSPFMAAATPPSVAEKNIQFSIPDTIPTFSGEDRGSNMLGLGSDMTESGKGMLLANPHLPWYGEFTYTEQHLMIPGELNASGVQIIGSPGLGIGFNEEAAQTVTISSTSAKYTIYLLALTPDDPTAYFYDSEVRSMTPTTISIDVLQEDGSLVPVEHTYYESHYGPMMIFPGIEWTTQFALSMRYPELPNIVDSYVQNLLVGSHDEFKALMRDVGGSAYLNITRVTEEGEVFFTDASPIPNLSADAINQYFASLSTNPLAGALFGSGIVLLNGSDSTFEWIDDPAAATPGTIPFDSSPQYQGRDYVVHNNDSAWLVNENNPIPLASPLYGSQGTPRQPRNRMGFELVRSEGGDDNKFNMTQLKNLQFSNRAGVAELIKDDLAAHCLIDPTFVLDGTEVDLTQACTLMQNWDGRLNTDSIGAPIFREFMANYTPAQITSGEGLFAVPYDPAQPATTPNTLLIADVPRTEDPLLRNLATAVTTLSNIGVPLDATLAEWQFTDRSGERLGIPGGSGEYEGAWNLLGYGPNNSIIHTSSTPELVNPLTALTPTGYIANSGPSYIMAVSFEGDTPTAEAMLVYGQSRDPNSPHHDDQMPLFAEGMFRPVHFTPEAVAANAVSEMTVQSDD